ncbi:small-conductance mechanosensitive channel [Sphingobium xanthum]|uniref:mechanosensitive ion channel family protein n=1 Tax=Sphingobium xanthum TaxID=1387165 RepID=UPI001FE92540|nr:mechanosensitive ion channel domain-containing protein [Sphingobium xanthum]
MSLQWIRDLGVKLPDAPDLESIMVVIVLIVGACAIGWFIAARAGSAVAGRLHRFGASRNVLTSGLVTSIIRCTIVALLLLIVGNAVRLSPLALMILAFALGMSVAILLFRLFVAFRISRMIATGLALLGLVATTAATLGGLTPLIDSLDAVGFTVGARRFSLLAVFNGIAIVALLYVVAKAVNHVLVHLIGRSSALDVAQSVLVQKLAGIAVIVVAILLGIDLLGIDLTALTVFSGAAGLAIGFGLQKTFGNLIAGLILLMDRSVKPGDVIVVGDTFGAVSKIGVRAVSVVTRDGKEHLIPNEQLMTEPVENWSYSSKNVRVHVSVGVSYNCDLALAQRLMIEAATAAKRVLADPKPSVWLKAFGDSSVDHDILVWIMDPELGVGNVRSDILNRIWVLFAEHGIEIPFPQRDVHIRTAPGESTTA